MAESRAVQVWALDEIEAAAWRDLIDAASHAVIAATGMAWARVGEATILMAPRIRSPLWNRALGIGNGEPATDALVDEVLVRLTAAGVADPWIQVSAASRPASIAQWLGARGFAAAPRRSWVKLSRGREPVPAMSTAFDVRELDGADAAPLARVLCPAHGVPLAVAPLIEALVGRRGWRAYGAFDGGALVAGAMLRVDGRDAWLGLAGTLASHRGRGAHGALVARRITDAIAQGATTIATETGAPVDGVAGPSLVNLERCGFQQVGLRATWCLVR
jgi:hypothetical protein